MSRSRLGLSLLGERFFWITDDDAVRGVFIDDVGIAVIRFCTVTNEGFVVPIDVVVLLRKPD